MKPTVYIETSVISYFTAKLSRDLIVAAHQQITHEWWEYCLPKFEAYISSFVIDEISKGDRDAVKKRLRAISQFLILQVSEDIAVLADRYGQAIDIPEKAKIDSFHLAIATWHGLDYLVSWNCKHIVSGKVRKIVEQINDSFGIRTPIICTPEELTEV
jgi:hypothetical protein